MRRSPWALQRIEQPPAARERVLPAPEQQAVEMTQDLAVMQERLAAAPMTATPATASPAWRLQHVSFEKLTCSYFGPVADQIVIVGQLQILRDAEIETTTRAGSGPSITRRSQTIDVRRWEAREAEKRREQNSDRRTRRRRSNTGMGQLGTPADKVVSRPPWRWPAPLPRRLRSHRLAGPRAHDRSGSSTG